MIINQNNTSVARGKSALFWCITSLVGVVLLSSLQPGQAEGKRPASQPSPSPIVEGEEITFETPAAEPTPRGRKQAQKVPCIPVRQIKVGGISLVESASIRAALTPLLKSCISNESASALVAAINETHVARGYITTQAYVPIQDIKASKTFVINIVTGRVGAIRYREMKQDRGLGDSWAGLGQATGPWDLTKRLSVLLDSLDNPLDRFQLLDPKWAGDIKARLALPVEEGEPLNLDDIQQGIDQINRAPSHKASAKLEAGQQPGTSDIVISNPRQDSFRFLMGYEINGLGLNSNASSASARRLRFDLAKDNLIGINDTVSTSFATGIDSNEVRASMAIPFRRLTLSADAGYSESLTPLSAAAELFSQTFTSAANASYLLSRDRDQQTFVQTGLNWRRSQRAINSFELTPLVVSYLRMGGSHTRFWENRQLSLSAGVNKGLSILDATHDAPGLASTVPRAQFLKFDAAITYLHAFKGWGTLRVDGNAQWSSTPLYSDDQITLGSISSVRGFTRAPFKADQGITLRSEFSIPLFADGVPGLGKEDFTFLNELLSSFQIYPFADFGYGRDIANTLDVTRASAGLGLRYRQGRLTADLSIAKPVHQQGLPHTRDDRKPEIYFTLSTKIF